MEGTLRMRVFAGPNGSGKSTIIDSIKNSNVNGHPIDFGVYINADDIAKKLTSDTFVIQEFGNIDFKKAEILTEAVAAGLCASEKEAQTLFSGFEIKSGKCFLKDKSKNEPIAQIIADFLRFKMLQNSLKFSFETVFSHEGKVELIQRASNLGYKVYFYFVGTESPQINQYRVKSRVQKGGHSVPEDKITSRYYRAMKLMKRASDFCYQGYFFDNSNDGASFSLFAHFKVANGVKVWDEIDWDKVPLWFHTYFK